MRKIESQHATFFICQAKSTFNFFRVIGPRGKGDLNLMLKRSTTKCAHYWKNLSYDECELL